MISQRVLIQILGAIMYKPWCVDSGFKHGSMGNGWYIQHWQMLRDCNSDNAAESEQRGRKWYISKHATVSEVVQTAFAAILAFEEHEARESFEYRGQRLFGPHIDINAHMRASHEVEKRDEREVTAVVV